MESKRYPTDLSDEEWCCIRPHLPEPTREGRPRLHGLRPILDAVFYVLKSGCPWRWLPKDFPPWKTVYDWFRRWRIDGTWERLNAELRELLRARLRPRQGSGGQEASPAGGHRGPGAPSAGPQRQGARPRRHQAAVGAGAHSLRAPFSPVGRRRLPGKGQALGRGGFGL